MKTRAQLEVLTQTLCELGPRIYSRVDEAIDRIKDGLPKP